MTVEVLGRVICNASSEGNHPLEVHFAGFTEPLKHPDFLTLIWLTEESEYVSSVVVYTTGEGLTLERLTSISKLKKLNAINFHCSVSQALRNSEKGVMAGSNGDIWKLVDTGMVSQILPLASFSFIERPGRAVRQAIGRRIGGRHKVFFSRKITRAANLSRQADESPKITHTGVVTCSKVRNKKMPVVLPNGMSVACCNDYGLKLPIGDLSEHSWESLDYGVVHKAHKQSSEDSPCHTDCHHARNVE
jgi:hypothetical protein